MRPVILLLLGAALAQSTFDERLDFYPLANGLLLAHFQFTQTIDNLSATDWVADYGSFPGAIYETVQAYGVAEFRLSFGRGRWDQRLWGQAPFDLANSGIQLHAWFGRDGVAVDQRWAKLGHTLSGLFCASVGLLSEAKTSVPGLSFARPAGGASLRYGVLPREAVCTENLTPWTKMLPCMANAGIAELLNPTAIYDSRYNLMDMAVARRGSAVEIKQGLAVVVDLQRWNKALDWSLSSLFGKKITRLCPPSAERAEISLHLDTALGRLLERNGSNTDQNTGRVRYTGQAALVQQNIGIDFNDNGTPPSTLAPSEILVERHLTGSGQERGTLFTRIENVSGAGVELVGLEVLPWYLRLSMHTLRTSITLGSLHYSPAVDRRKPAQIEYRVALPAGAVMTMELDFEMTLLRYSEYPLDPNRGFDIK